MIGHLVQNAAEATTGDGHIWVRARREGEQAVIEVEDDGKGMSERFIRESLFRPFASTKEHGMGIGTFESREYIRELGGRLEVASREREGTTFRIVLAPRIERAGGLRPPIRPEQAQCQLYWITHDARRERTLATR